MNERENFLYPKFRYRGEFNPESMMFDSNLQDFAQRIGYVCFLENGGKISQEEAYQEIKRLWKRLKESRRELGIGEQEH